MYKEHRVHERDPGITRDPVEFIRLAADSGVSFVRLVLAELHLTLSKLPLLGLLWIVMVPLVVFSWLGFSVLLSWLVYVWTVSPGWAIAAFLALQVVCCGLVFWKIQGLTGDVAFPASRRQLERMAPEAK